MRCCVLLALHELPHEVAQELCGCAVAGLGGGRKVGFQGFIDPECKGGFAHVGASVCYVVHTE